jgi:dTDP-4-amino-4,6-dideoxygalactose transaminase
MIKILDKNKIGNRIYYIPIHVQEFFKNLNVKDKFPKSEYFYEHIKEFL